MTRKRERIGRLQQMPNIPERDTHPAGGDFIRQAIRDIEKSGDKAMPSLHRRHRG